MMNFAFLLKAGLVHTNGSMNGPTTKKETISDQVLKYHFEGPCLPSAPPLFCPAFFQARSMFQAQVFGDRRYLASLIGEFLAGYRFKPVVDLMYPA